uniref:Ankyrin repeat domain-containing protein 37 n=1 Tax=Canis lupus familiaris TaxID=9615 RepID=A0A8P0SCR6_CANLF
PLSPPPVPQLPPSKPRASGTRGRGGRAVPGSSPSPHHVSPSPLPPSPSSPPQLPPSKPRASGTGERWGAGGDFERDAKAALPSSGAGGRGARRQLHARRLPKAALARGSGFLVTCAPATPASPRGPEGRARCRETCPAPRASWPPPDPAAPRPRRRTRTGAPRGSLRAPPRGGRGCASRPANQRAALRRPPPPASPAGRAATRAGVCVRAAPAGRAGQGGRAGRGRGGAGAARGPGNLNSPAPGGPRTRTSRPAATAPPLCTGPGPPVLCVRRKMQLLDCNPEVDGVQHLLEAGASVNAPPDPCEQAPVHLAAGGGLACFLLWQLQSGADLNQQDVFGEAPLHKAAKVGSLECLSLLVASDAQIDLCNKNGQTAEDLAWACGFLECAKFLTTIKCMQTIKSSDRSDRDHCVPVLRQKRSFGSAENTTGKRKC